MAKKRNTATNPQFDLQWDLERLTNNILEFQAWQQALIHSARGLDYLEEDDVEKLSQRAGEIAEMVVSLHKVSEEISDKLLRYQDLLTAARMEIVSRCGGNMVADVDGWKGSSLHSATGAGVIRECELLYTLLCGLTIEDSDFEDELVVDFENPEVFKQTINNHPDKISEWLHQFDEFPAVNRSAHRAELNFERVQAVLLRDQIQLPSPATIEELRSRESRNTFKAAIIKRLELGDRDTKAIMLATGASAVNVRLVRHKWLKNKPRKASA